MSTLETIEHVTYEGETKVTYDVDVEISYDIRGEIETLDILSINEVDANYISNAFLNIIKEEIIEDLEADNINSNNPLDIEPSLLLPQI